MGGTPPYPTPHLPLYLQGYSPYSLTMAVLTMQGAFYLLPDVSAYFGKATPQGQVITSAEVLCMALLDKYKVHYKGGWTQHTPAAA